MWYVGQKVVCVRTRDLVCDQRHPDASIAAPISEYPWPECGKVYTISGIWDWFDGHLFQVKEIDEPFVSYHEELFRPEKGLQ
jgi:hypothetical protein